MRSNRNNRSKTAIPPPPPSTSSTESDYAFSLTKIAVSQICNSIGFTTAETPALRTLTDIAARYLRSMAKSAADLANSGGRTESNLIDTVAAVDELSSITGFPGAWRAAGSLLSSGAVKELLNFSNYSEEIPFAKPLQRKIFSTEKGRKGVRNLECDGNEYIGGEWKHIPKWLPIMPVIKEEEEEKERGAKGEKEMWGFCGGKIEREREEKGKESKRREKKGIKILPLKRGKVRFKIGNNNGVLRVCKRGGIGGKRVLCDSWVGDEKNQNQSKKRSLR